LWLSAPQAIKFAAVTLQILARQAFATRFEERERLFKFPLHKFDVQLECVHMRQRCNQQEEGSPVEGVATILQVMPVRQGWQFI
jgi:hypothetical protein